MLQENSLIAYAVSGVILVWTILVLIKKMRDAKILFILQMIDNILTKQLKGEQVTAIDGLGLVKEHLAEIKALALQARNLKLDLKPEEKIAMTEKFAEYVRATFGFTPGNVLQAMNTPTLAKNEVPIELMAAAFNHTLSALGGTYSWDKVVNDWLLARKALKDYKLI
jgi:hypothetical protein